MIRINLLGVERQKARKAVAFDVGQRLTLACSLILVVAALGIGWWYWSLNEESARVDAEIAAAQQEAARLQSLLAEVQQFEARRGAAAAARRAHRAAAQRTERARAAARPREPQPAGHALADRDGAGRQRADHLRAQHDAHRALGFRRQPRHGRRCCRSRSRSCSSQVESVSGTGAQGGPPVELITFDSEGADSDAGRQGRRSGCAGGGRCRRSPCTNAGLFDLDTHMAMNLSLSKLPWYGQIGAFVALSLAAAGVFWNWYAQPAQASIDQRQAQLATIRADIDRGLATARRLPEFRQEIARLEAQLERLQDRAAGRAGRGRPAAPRAGHGHAVESRRFAASRRAPSPRSRCTWSGRSACSSKAPITTSATSSSASASSRASSTSAGSTSARREAATGPTITAECTATTFVLIETPPPAAPGAAPRQGADGVTAMIRRHALTLMLVAVPAVVTRRRCGAPGSRTHRRPRRQPLRRPPVVPVEPQGFDYDPEGRRDPFVSLVRRGSDTAKPSPGSRGPGLGGLETAEVTLRGTLQSRDGYVAILAGADNKTYIVRVGRPVARRHHPVHHRRTQS